MTKGMFDLARQRGTSGKLGQLNPLGRYGVPIGTVFTHGHLHAFTVYLEVAHMALFLASGKTQVLCKQHSGTEQDAFDRRVQLYQRTEYRSGRRLVGFSSSHSRACSLIYLAIAMLVYLGSIFRFIHTLAEFIIDHSPSESIST